MSSCFVISPKGLLRYYGITDVLVPLNISESLRMVKAFKFSDSSNKVCPAYWEPGKTAIAPDADDPKTAAYFE